jgi:hypothetical protein
MDLRIEGRRMKFATANRDQGNAMALPSPMIPELSSNLLGAAGT